MSYTCTIGTRRYSKQRKKGVNGTRLREQIKKGASLGNAKMKYGIQVRHWNWINRAVLTTSLVARITFLRPSIFTTFSEVTQI